MGSEERVFSFLRLLLKLKGKDVLGDFNPADKDAGMDIKSSKFDFNFFGKMTLFFGLAVLIRNGWGAGLASGVMFGLCMTALKLYFGRDKALLGPSGIFQISQPLVLVWFIIFIFWLFFCCFLLFGLFFSEDVGPMVGSFFLLMSIFLLFLLFLGGTDVVVGRTYLLERHRFPFQRHIYHPLDSITEVRLTWYQVLRVRFASNRVLRFSSADWKHGELPEFQGKIENPMLEGLLRIRQELEFRSLEARRSPSQDTEFEKHEMERMKAPFGWSAFIAIGIVSLMIFGSGGMWLHLNRLSTLTEATDPQALRQHHFEDAFSFYRGFEFDRMKAEAIRICMEKSDYHCRFVYYLSNIEDKTNGHFSWVSKSCSDVDPQSCYILYSGEKVSAGDKKIAGDYLSSYCEKSENSSAACCTCYRADRDRSDRD